MKTYTSRIVTISSIAIALLLIISAYSLASDDLHKRTKGINLGPLSLSSLNGETLLLLFRVDRFKREASFGGTDTFTYTITDGELDSDGGICTQTFIADIPFRNRKLNYLKHSIRESRGGSTFIITDFENGVDILNIDLDPCFGENRTVFEIGMKRSTYRKIRDLTASIIKEGVGSTIFIDLIDNRDIR
jgi:hypothetical protein